MDKALIAARFSRARDTYSREARVQQQVADKMLHLLTVCCPERFRHIVEFGCGTGSYSRLLYHHLHPDTLLLNDLCTDMQECLDELLASASVRFRPGDAEALDFPPGTDLITSCSTLQWFSHPGRFFQRCHSSLREEGVLAFTTFGPENMREIRSLTGHGLEYLTLEQLTTLLAPGFQVLHASEELATLTFNSPVEVLRHLRNTGVTGTEKRIWTRGRLDAFCQEYTRRFCQEGGRVCLTYHPIYIICKKSKQ